MMRPYGFAPFIPLDDGKNESPPSIVVLLLSAKSAEPPQNSGSTPAIALITFPEAARVATSFPGSNTGSAESHPVGNSRLTRRSRSAALSGCAAFQESNLLFQSLRVAAPRSLTRRMCARTSSGKANFSSGLRPSSTLVAAISSSPSAEPCDFAVLRSFGAGHAITDFIRISVG